MKKATKVLAILAAVLILLATVGSVCLTALDLIMAVPKDASIYHLSRIVPVSDLTSMSLTLLIGIVICFTAGSKKVGMWSDIVLPAAVLTVVPATAYFVRYLYAVIVYLLCDVDLLYSYYAGSDIKLIQILHGINQDIVAIGFALLLVTCGMSIACKCLKFPIPLLYISLSL